MTTASSLVPLWSRHDEWECRLAMIADAGGFLYLSTYYLEFDDFGRELLAALLAAARRGVAVHLLIDSFGQRLGGVLMTAEANAALAARLTELRALGATVTFYRPAHRVQQQLGGGQHVKIQVSEVGAALFGSSNISHSSFAGWNEYSVLVRGAVVPELLGSYRALGGEVTEADLRELRALADAEPGDLPLEYWLCNPNLLQGRFGPLGWRGVNPVTDGLLRQLASARQSVAITSFYFKPEPGLLAAVLAAARRGVQVDVFHSHRDALPATDLAWLAAAASYGALLGAGVRIFENRHGEHSKLVLIDGTWAAFGSYNFEDAAHDRLAEAMLVSADRRAVDPVAAIFDGLREDSDQVQVTARGLAELPLRLRVRRAALGPFKRWL